MMGKERSTGFFFFFFQESTGIQRNKIKEEHGSLFGMYLLRWETCGFAWVILMISSLLLIKREV